uniref:Uncharacterized protein n=1 Tax=Mola mola TaxID=94237 RepID=A0A3Q3X757_MOLML
VLTASSCFLFTSSIPSSTPTKHQRLVTESQGQTGPGSYGLICSADVQTPSFSKKGTTGFAARPSSPLQGGIPAPNAYNLQRSLTGKRGCNVEASRVFRLSVAMQRDIPKHRTAPNQYDVCTRGSRQNFSSVVGTSPFLSQTQRESFYPNNNVPSSCHYEVNNIIQRGSEAVVTPFESKTQRIFALVDHGVPGPGAYSPHQTPAQVKRTILPRRRYLAISAPPLKTEGIPRNSQTDMCPGPGN